MSDRFALELQLLGTAPEKVLVLGSLLGSRSANRTFSVADLSSSFRDLRVPAPGNISQALATLKQRQMVVTHSRGSWAVTPLGRQHADELITHQASVSAELTPGLPGAEFAHVQHTVIPAWAAPPRWQTGIKRLLDAHPFETNVFCMTRFPSEGPTPDPVATAVEVMREVLAAYGLTLHLASDGLLDDDLLASVGAYMWGSQYGIGIIEDRAGKGVNYNAVIELGGMIVTGRRCAILKDRDIDALPTDLVGQVYRTVDLANSTTVRRQVDEWAANDLGLRRR